MLEDHHIGGFSFLTCEQKEELCEHLRAYTYLRAADICIHVEETYKVCYTVKGMQALLKHMGFSYKKPKHVPGKTDKQKQEQFIKEYERLMRTKAEEDKVYFMDGMHPMHNSQPAYGWIKKGEEKQLKANTGRQRLNLNGAYNIEDHKVVIKEEDRIDANAIVSLLRAIKKRQRQGISHVILDNAPYNRSRIVQMFVTENPQIKLIYLPPYSPNLNLIERLWKFFRKNITYNRYYEKFSVFKEESMDFFKNINIHRNELRSLMTQNFELIC